MMKGVGRKEGAWCGGVLGGSGIGRMRGRRGKRGYCIEMEVYGYGSELG